ncbi:DUF3704 domain-containing protein [Nocardia puris]|nr:DUF3704 domain-containing protein [Nocardia puris]MBF6368646.1 DUF3704 domain-containing protein [Nocardia puris]MBF6461548.1 DUF3704 domain-containing protein [Nocardia puris]
MPRQPIAGSSSSAVSTCSSAGS